ncbi:50S ribosomal protein L9 [Campylobacter sp. RM9344]|uniref:Large ribosomal subunit protein bL9 n=1 Tax=Campylobacter californiensis TaxID=1032243 RepID=A0AAW3ZXK4_9BACT|nr:MULTISPECIES: 50S ribosomal protein L9 [unclassified Campylobacter]MBE2984213.1 50S ribosomal protein L9 [Campylobacter sp. RM6883]MBE2986032.1 50S ribosomal protein L9 [Campylobacter sp. RM12919]MBE2988288.1 50S ribosomal protein L9 [Campylobacter sp. RM12920]MBE2994920.1 50S ribosomal protein L9 [Campylobacter sp. RM6913]MBE3022723.1 50S ribosomal protein L9 [Campylobacter sp. 7477a]MBE3029442.1 50S ribosomal protein L9 [Campylobacter sp. RM9344]
MKVLLIKDVKGLGKAGEIKEVKDGYGNNFLIGKGFAKAATPDVLRQYEAAQKRKAEELKYELANLEKLKDELAKVTVVIKKQLGANGALFGSVSKEEIAEELEKTHHLIVDKKSIEIEKNHLKAVGIYNVQVKLGHAISADLKVDVQGE